MFMNKRAFIFLLLLIFVVALFTYRTQTASKATQFGDVSLKLEYATKETTRQIGLGRRTSLSEDEAMLFVFPKSDRYGFWMKDMLIPIDIFWLDDKGQVVTIAEQVATSSYPNVFYPSAPARYVLETVSGFAQRHAITTNSKLLLKDFPSVSQ